MTRTLFKRLKLYFKDKAFHFDRFEIEQEWQSVESKEAIKRIEAATEDMETTIRIVEGQHRLGMTG